MEVSKAIEEAKKVAVVVAEDSKDALSAGAAMYHVLKDLAKEVTLCSPFEVALEGGVTAFFQRELGSKDLVVSFDLSKAPIQKVSYFSEGGVFNLILHPIPKNFDPSEVKFSYTLPTFDLWLVLGLRDLESLPAGLIEYKEDLLGAKSIVIAKKPSFGTEKIDLGERGYCETLFLQFSEWGLVPSKDAARALLEGISSVA